MPRKNPRASASSSENSDSGDDDDFDSSGSDDGEDSSSSSGDESSGSDAPAAAGGGDGSRDAASDDYDPLNDALDALIDSVADYDDPGECWDLVRAWLREHSREETQEAMELKGEFDTTALHVACRNHPPLDVVDLMLMAGPDMIFWADSFGWIPLHYGERCDRGRVAFLPGLSLPSLCNDSSGEIL
jgi:hypothetical protein